MSPCPFPLSIIMVVTPEILSPLRMARLMGAAPLYLGNREECKLIKIVRVPLRGLHEESDRMQPQ
ncbi:MAG: hypothetical protein CM1200mP16_16810 [Nitrospina sp.]|nr:MAG: hypothetical protein CM1200mP16_16810 [Nitrospina sp.]